MSRQSSTSSDGTSTWTRDSHDTWTTYTIVEPRQIVLTTLKVKVMTTEPGCPTSIAAATVKEHQVTKWIKSSFEWCVKALTLCCLRKKHTYTEVYRAPALGSKPTRATNQRGISSSIDFVALQSPRPRKQSRIVALLPDVKDADDGLNVLPTRDTLMKSGIWSRDEHERYCEALEIFRYGSWKQIAEYVGSRTERQVLSHAQSIRARKKKDEERRQTESTSKLKAVDQNAITPVLSTPNLRKTQQFTSEELLAASMTGVEPRDLPLVIKKGVDVTCTDDETVDLPPWDLSLDVELSLCEDTDAMYDEEDTQRISKRLKLNTDADTIFNPRLTSSSLEMLLDSVLSDEDQLLEIPSTESDIELL